MKTMKLFAIVMAVLLCFTACANKQEENPQSAPVGTSSPEDVPDEPPVSPESTLPQPITDQEPTKEGETYQARGRYIGMGDSNLIYFIEMNAADGRKDQSYQISPEIDLDAMGITEGCLVDLTYTVDEHGIKQVQTISVIIGE